MEGANKPPTYPPNPFVEDAPPSPTHDNNNHGSTATDSNMTDAPNNNTTNGAEADKNRVNIPVNDGAAASNATPAQEPKAPNPETPQPASDRVQIVLKDQSGNQMAFGVKSTTRMEKVMNVYADKTGRPLNSLRFHFDGVRVLPEHTVESLDMENEDIIEVMSEQIGGGGGIVSQQPDPKPEKYVAKHFPEADVDEYSFVVNSVTVDGKHIDEMEFVVGRDTKIKDFMNTWSSRSGCSLDSVVFRTTDEKQGPGLPYWTEDETFGDTDWDSSDAVYVNSMAEEPINLVRPRPGVAARTSEPSSANVKGDGESSGKALVITVKYLGQDDLSREMHCKINLDTPFADFIVRYSERWDIDASAQRLTFDRKTVFPSDTPASIGVETGAVFEVAEDPIVLPMDLTLG